MTDISKIIYNEKLLGYKKENKGWGIKKWVKKYYIKTRKPEPVTVTGFFVF